MVNEIRTSEGQISEGGDTMGRGIDQTGNVSGIGEGTLKATSSRVSGNRTRGREDVKKSDIP